MSDAVGGPAFAAMAGAAPEGAEAGGVPDFEHPIAADTDATATSIAVSRVNFRINIFLLLKSPVK